ncbi:MAG TPA: DUF1385 domain-containing protein [Gaiellaceae bacterium]|nr:DUF1385 domain-containing protein [Gaiellaceae bacterium]
MEHAAVLELLERADAADALPRLGGMARANGVVVVSERHWAFAGVDGSLRQGTMPRTPEPLRRVPLVRGLARLALSLSPLFRRRGVARRRERWLLALAVAAPPALVFVPHTLSVVAGVAITGGLVAWLLRGRTLFLHGAEHRAIAAVEARRLRDTWGGVVKPSRFSPRCGTNFAALLLPTAMLGERFWPLGTAAFATPLVVTVLSLAVTMELWQLVQSSSLRAARLLLVPGLLLQRVTTREPTLEETRVALRAVAAVLRHDLA